MIRVIVSGKHTPSSLIHVAHFMTDVNHFGWRQPPRHTCDNVDTTEHTRPCCLGRKRKREAERERGDSLSYRPHGSRSSEEADQYQQPAQHHILPALVLWQLTCPTDCISLLFSGCNISMAGTPCLVPGLDAHLRRENRLSMAKLVWAHPLPAL